MTTINVIKQRCDGKNNIQHAQKCYFDDIKNKTGPLVVYIFLITLQRSQF